jgi:hypothetical protein
VSIKDIRTARSDVELSCDVCGRTLLRGERAHPYLERGEHRTVCELCTTRAHQEGWIREGTVPAFDDAAASADRRRSLLGRLRRRRDRVVGDDPATPGADAAYGQARSAAERPRRRLRESRHVRAIPTSAEHRIASAIEAFNASEHPRTVSGVARSLGIPIVSVRPVPGRPSVVQLVVAWELYWYRYELDLADEDAGVRVIDQGQELDELAEDERDPNAICLDTGMLAVPE